MPWKSSYCGYTAATFSSYDDRPQENRTTCVLERYPCHISSRLRGLIGGTVGPRLCLCSAGLVATAYIIKKLVMPHQPVEHLPPTWDGAITGSHDPGGENRFDP